MNHNISLQIHLEYNMRTYTAVCFTFFMTSHLAIIAMKNRNLDMHIKLTRAIFLKLSKF